MKRRLRRLTVLIGVIGLVMAFNVGTAFADHTGQGTDWTCNTEPGGEYGEPCPPPQTDKQGPAAVNAYAPVGSNIGPNASPNHPGFENGIDGDNTPDDILFRNPLCPFHNDSDHPDDDQAP
jgi:hypothetical protein